MLGVGGMLAEAIADVVFRPAPLIGARRRGDARRAAHADGCSASSAGRRRVDRAALVAALVGLGRLAIERPDVVSVDVNPLIVGRDGSVVAVDALVEVGDPPGAPPPARPPLTAEQFARPVRAAGRRDRRRLHPPRQVRLRRHAQPARRRIRGSRVRARTSRARRCSASRTVAARSTTCRRARPTSSFVCTPGGGQPRPAASRARPRASAPRSSPRPGTARRARPAATPRRELVAAADRARDPARRAQRAGARQHAGALCAQIVAPYPPAGRIGIASQSGNFVSSFMNYATATGVGISRAVSAGNAAAVGVADYLELLRRRSGDRGRARLRREHRRRSGVPRPAAPGHRAQAGRARQGRRHRRRSSAPRPATPARWPPTTRCSTVACRAVGITRAATVEEAFEAAATFATQPLPAGPNVVVLTTAGGWGVVTADAITADRDLVLLDAARRPAGRDRRAAAAAVEPQQPRRLRRRRDPRHDPRGDAPAGRASRRSTPSSTSVSASSRTRRG